MQQIFGIVQGKRCGKVDHCRGRRTDCSSPWGIRFGRAGGKAEFGGPDRNGDRVVVCIFPKLEDHCSSQISAKLVYFFMVVAVHHSGNRRVLQLCHDRLHIGRASGADSHRSNRTLERNDVRQSVSVILPAIQLHRLGDPVFLYAWNR